MRNHVIPRFYVCALIGFLCAGGFTSSRLNAQLTTATISGTATDTSGAAVPDTEIVVRNTGTGSTRTAKTDALGRYIVADLAVGEYEAEATKASFSAERRTGITLTVGSQVVVDFSLSVGQQAQTVTVEGQVSQVDTTSAAVANLVEQKQIQELPLNGRNFEQLLTLAPGVVVASNITLTLLGVGNTYSISGGRAEGMAMMLDGTDIMDFYNKGTGAAVLGTSLGIDGIAEFQTLTNTYGAQFAGQGGVINAVSKSGTDSFHGSVYEFLRNSDVDARNFFDGAAPPPFRRNQFGGAIGGPIKKDKAFFFFNYEGLRQELGLTEIAQVPDANVRNGIYLGKTYALTPFVQSLLALYPATTAISSTGVVKIPEVANQVSNENYYLGRFDYAFSDKDSLFVRLVSDKGTLANPFASGAVPLWPDFEQSPNLFLTTEERHIVSTNIVNVVRASFVRTDSQAAISPSAPPIDWVPGNGAQGGTLAVAGLTTIGALANDPFRTLQYKYTLYDDVFWTKGAHSFKFGFSGQMLQTLFVEPFKVGGAYTFTSIPSLLNGTPLTYGGALPGDVDSYHWYREWPVNFYFNDDWKVTSRLTLNLGIRYEYDTNPVTLTHDIYQVVNPPLGTGYSPITHVFANNPNTKNWDPRFGIAYDPFKDHKTSIRGGFGIFHDPVLPRTYVGCLATHDPEVTVQITNPLFPNPFLNPTAPPVPSDSACYDYQTNVAPYLMEWNVSLQREVLKDTILTVAYVGSGGVHLFVQRDLNPPAATIEDGVYHFASVVNGKTVSNPRLNPNFGPLANFVADGNSNYNSLQVNLSHRFTHNFQVQAAYTWSHSLDVSSGTYANESNGGAENPYNLNYDYGPSNFDIRHSLVVNGVYALPFHGNRFVDGWQISGVVTAHTGTPFSPFVGYDVAGLGGNNIDQRPNLNPGYTANNIVTGNPNQWFKPAAFSVPAAGTLGNVGRDVLRNPGLFDADLSAIKDTKLSEQFRLQFRAELFNILNHTNFAPFGYGSNNGVFTSTGISPTAGLITATSTTSRQIQFALKLIF
jgi:outer membrane receptor protein involved in Fe transport